MKSDASGPDRLQHEIEHHRRLIEQNLEEVWGWSSYAGRRRADRRGKLFVQFGAIRPGTRVLELGCGTGEFTRRVAPVGPDLVALDLSSELLARACSRVGAGAHFVRGNAEVLPFRDATFDVVFGCSVLHHLAVQTALAEVYRVLRQGGRLVFSEPNLLNPQVWLMFNYGLLRRRVGASRDEMAFTRRAISQILERLAFARFSVHYFDFLHPATPMSVLPLVEPLAQFLEDVPLLNAISGSLLIYAER